MSHGSICDPGEFSRWSVRFELGQRIVVQTSISTEHLDDAFRRHTAIVMDSKRISPHCELDHAFCTSDVVPLKKTHRALSQLRRQCSSQFQHFGCQVSLVARQISVAGTLFREIAFCWQFTAMFLGVTGFRVQRSHFGAAVLYKKVRG